MRKSGNTLSFMVTELKKYLESIEKIALQNKNECYLVGGYLRDLFLKRPTKDFDFTFKKNPKQLAKKFAEEFNGSFFILKEEEEIYRVATKNRLQFDFAKFKGSTIHDDLSKRDFSINAMALPIANSDLPLTNTIDSYSGRNDLEKKMVRQISPQIYSNDPLRLLRSFRIGAQLGFQIDSNTLKTIEKNKSKIEQTAAERIREEILLILDCSNSYPTIQKLDQFGFISIIFPEVDRNRQCALEYYPGKGVWGHSLDGLESLEWIFKNLSKEFPEDYEKISTFLFQEGNETEGHPGTTLMKLAILFHDIGKADTEKVVDGRTRFFQHEEVGAKITRKIAQRLKFSSNSGLNLSKMVQAHMRPGGLAHSPLLTERAKYRFFRDLGVWAIPSLLVSLADRYSYLSSSDRGANKDLHEKVVKELIRWYYEKELEKPSPKPKLINGNILMEKFGLQPGPLVGKILKEVEEMIALKEINTPQEALQFSEIWLKKNSH